MNDLTDEELIAQCASGNRGAMDLLVGRYHGRLIDFACRYLHDREASADVAQRALIQAFQSAGSYRATAKFKTWLYTIALNMVRDEARRRKARRESLESEVEGEEWTLDKVEAGASPQDEALRKVYSSEVWDAVSELTEDQQIAVTLRFRHELSYEEIASITGAPSGTVRAWVHRALRKLRDRLGPAKCEADHGL